MLILFLAHMHYVVPELDFKLPWIRLSRVSATKERVLLTINNNHYSSVDYPFV